MAQTPSTTDYDEIQENEVQVLQSIFMEDFVEEKAKAGAWNVGSSLVKGPPFSLSLPECHVHEDSMSLLLCESIRPYTFLRSICSVLLSDTLGVNSIMPFIHRNSCLGLTTDRSYPTETG